MKRSVWGKVRNLFLTYEHSIIKKFEENVTNKP